MSTLWTVIALSLVTASLTLAVALSVLAAHGDDKPHGGSQ